MSIKVYEYVVQKGTKHNMDGTLKEHVHGAHNGTQSKTHTESMVT